MERDSEDRNGTAAASVRRVTAVLDAFASADGDLGVSELASQLGLAKSVVHRLVSALADADYLSHDRVSRRYSLGPRAVRLGLIAVGHIRIRERALPYLREVAAQTGETVTLSLLVGDERVYAEQVESSQAVRQTIRIGERAHLFSGASGKAMLAFLPAAQRAAILGRLPRTPRANGSVVDPHRLAAELDEIRKRGYAISQSERVLGAASAAAPVFDHHGEVVACVSVAGVTIRHGAAQLAEFGVRAADCAARLSADLGWTGRPDQTD